MRWGQNSVLSTDIEGHPNKTWKRHWGVSNWKPSRQ